MTKNKSEKTEHFQFPITPFLQRKLNALSKQVNTDGNKSVRWTDIILAGLNKLEPADLVQLKRDRDLFVSNWAKKEGTYEQTL